MYEVNEEGHAMNGGDVIMMMIRWSVEASGDMYIVPIDIPSISYISCQKKVV